MLQDRIQDKDATEAKLKEEFLIRKISKLRYRDLFCQLPSLFSGKLVMFLVENLFEIWTSCPVSVNKATDRKILIWICGRLETRNSG